MSYKKIIPCLDLENALEMAKFYNDAGADEIAYFDSKASEYCSYQRDLQECRYSIDRMWWSKKTGRYQEDVIRRCFQGLYEISSIKYTGACNGSR